MSSFEDWEKTHGYGIVGESSSDSDDDEDFKYDDSYEGKLHVSVQEQTYPRVCNYVRMYTWIVCNLSVEFHSQFVRWIILVAWKKS